MDIRGTVNTDAETLAAITDASIRAMCRLIHDRTVRLVTVKVSPDPHVDVPADDESVLGFVSFNVRDGVLHVAHLGGAEAAVRQLLEEPPCFASAEDLPVKVLVLESEAPLYEAAEHAGFDRVGHGPWSEGSPTLQYVFDEAG